MGNTQQSNRLSFVDIQELLDEDNIDKLNTTFNRIISEPKINNTRTDLDAIACEYILTMDYPSMKNMQIKDYCNKITTLASDLVENSLPEKEIDYWYKRIRNSDGETKEKCINIARFYTKIGHLFSAIMMAINPQYIYVDKTGNRKKIGIQEKHLIPNDTEIHVVTSGLCQKRIDILMDKDFLSPKEDPLLIEETGIPELMDLYYDADYDKETGTFRAMKQDTAETYKQDVDMFYKTFTGEKNVPENITSFSQIRLKDFSRGNKDASLKQRIYSYRSSLLITYAENIRNMMTEMNEKHERLLDILNQLFLVEERENTIVLIHPRMTEETLQQIIEESRKIIIELYLHCEKDYEQGLKIYEAIVESLILDTSQKQIKTLEEELESLYRP